MNAMWHLAKQNHPPNGFFLYLAVFSLLLGLPISPVGAQVSDLTTLRGTIVDESGALVPLVHVSILD